LEPTQAEPTWEIPVKGADMRTGRNIRYVAVSVAVGLWTLGAALSTGSGQAWGAPKRGPLKIFLLAGQIQLIAVIPLAAIHFTRGGRHRLAMLVDHGADIAATGAAKHHDGHVRPGQGADGPADEVGVAGGVDDVDERPGVLEVGGGGVRGSGHGRHRHRERRLSHPHLYRRRHALGHGRR
jgi:hypothetical protein